MSTTRSRAVAAVLAVLSGAFVVDLFFDWRTLGVGFQRMMSVHVATSGWDGWGLVAGITALAVLVYALLEVSGYIPEETGTEVAPAVLGIIVCLATIAEYRSLTSVDVVNVVTIERTGAATVGLVLAVALAVVSVARLVLMGPAFSGRSHPAH